MTESFLDGRVTLHAGDCLDVLDRLPEASVDAVITDPPYHFDTIVQRFGKAGAAPAKAGTDGLFKRASAGFMGREWDGGDVAFRPQTWAKVLRVLKPGGHLAAFSAPKCVHKMGFAIEAAGFEVRDRIPFLHDPDERVAAFLDSLSPAQADALFRLLDTMGGLGEALWIYGTGFPKNHDVAKGIDKHLGRKGDVEASGAPVKRMIPGADQHKLGWEKTSGREYQPGTYRPGSPEARVWTGWGTALKPAYEPILIARKPLAEGSVAANVLAWRTGAINVDGCRVGDETWHRSAPAADLNRRPSDGIYAQDTWTRHWIANRGPTESKAPGRWPANLVHDGSDAAIAGFPDDDGASAARFFYAAKADAHDRIGTAHPTVKPVDLMQWLCRMLCPPGGTVLDLFAGTGTTGEAAFREGMNAILIEREADYRADIARRMAHVTSGPVARRHAAAIAKAARKPLAPKGAGDLPDLLDMIGD